MKEEKLLLAKHNCGWATSTGSPSNETNLKINKEISEFFGKIPKDNEKIPVVFTIYKDDFIKSWCFIISKLQNLAETSTGKYMAYSQNLFENGLSNINNFFKDSSEKQIHALLGKPKGHSICLNFGADNFPIRYYLVQNYSVLYFKEKNGEVSVRLSTNARNSCSDNINNVEDSDIEMRQLIYYGAPGTGKSYKIDQDTNDNNSIRTTFHPDSDYASFVGAYKPTMEPVPMSYVSDGMAKYAKDSAYHPGTERKIVYKYVPQAFLKAYVAAWSNLDKPFYLIIEEINRGNCAQIFGDLFQLLDRNNHGSSSYAIAADEDIAQFLADDKKGFANLSEAQRQAISDFILVKDDGRTVAIGPDILNGSKLLLPPNLRIWATMNTSDQSLFPIDSAFKRRWDWEYIPIEYDKKEWILDVNGVKYSWGSFLETINPVIYKLTESSDKQMGFFFAKADKKSDDSLPENDTISTKLFINKVLFYLWTDVLKDYAPEDDLFRWTDEDNVKQQLQFTDFFKKNGKELLQGFMDGLANLKGSKLKRFDASTSPDVEDAEVADEVTK